MSGVYDPAGEPPNGPLLRLTLEVAVPLWIEKLRRYSPEYREARAHELADLVASTADVAQYRGGKRGDTATAFNSIAESIACCAFSPGGVTVFGLHFEAEVPR